MSAIPAIHWRPGFRPALPALLGTSFRTRPVSPPCDTTDTRARLDFVREMLDRHPEAFASEHDLRAMMLLFPQHF